MQCNDCESKICKKKVSNLLKIIEGSFVSTYAITCKKLKSSLGLCVKGNETKIAVL